MRGSWATLALALTTAASTARGDTFSGTRFDMRERAHDVAVRVDRGAVTLVVRRTVHNPGPKSDQAVFGLEVPEQAVATRLRTSSVDRAGNTVWFEGELLDAELAAARYRELTGIGGFYPKDPALLSWRHRGLLALQVFPVIERSDKTVEYTLELPMRYQDGAYRISVPRLGTEALPATFHVRAGSARDALTVNGVKVPAGGSIEASGSGAHEAAPDIDIALVPHARTPLLSRIADVRVAAGKHLLHASFDAAPKLGTVPSNPAIAIVLDTSKSMGEDLPAALTALDAYLAHFGSGRVTVFTFDRTVHTPLGIDLPGADVIAALQTFRPALGNGSALDAAVAAADRALAHADTPVRRMVVLTDLQMRASLTPARLAALDLRSGAIVHVARVTRGEPSNLRDDDSPWAQLPRQTGGVLWTAQADRWDPRAREVFEEWARPKRIDNLQIHGLADFDTEPTTLDEGQGIEHFVLTDMASGPVTLEGELWSKPLRGTLRSSRSEERRWSALVFGSPLADQLSEPEQRRLAMRGRAVSPMTSYLAIEPGVRPSTEGLERVDQSGFAGGGVRGEGIAVGSVGGSGGPAFDALGWLSPRLSAAWRRCGGTQRVRVELETTSVEVVHVGQITLAPADRSGQSCLHEAAWALDLPAAFEVASGAWRVAVEP